MTFGEGVLRLVRGSFWQADIDPEPETELELTEVSSMEADAQSPAPTIEVAAALAPVVGTGETVDTDPIEVPAGQADLLAHEPGFSDIEAAVALVVAGLARSVVLSNFPSWPGLLWRAYRLAEETNVTVMPTVVRPGGRVDIVVAKEIAAND